MIKEGATVRVDDDGRVGRVVRRMPVAGCIFEVLFEDGTEDLFTGSELHRVVVPEATSAPGLDALPRTMRKGLLVFEAAVKALAVEAYTRGYDNGYTAGRAAAKG